METCNVQKFVFIDTLKSEA